VLDLLYFFVFFFFFFFSSRRRHTRLQGDWSSDVCSSDLSFRFRGLSVATRRSASSTIAVSSTSGFHLFSNSNTQPLGSTLAGFRSEERRVGKECRSRRARDQ